MTSNRVPLTLVLSALLFATTGFAASKKFDRDNRSSDSNDSSLTNGDLPNAVFGGSSGFQSGGAPGSSGSPPMLGSPGTLDNWNGGTGNWSNAGNWSVGLPGGESDVVINTGSDFVTLDTTAIINTLTLGGAFGVSTLAGNGTTQTLTIAGALTVNPTGYLDLTSGEVANASTLVNNGHIQVFPGATLNLTNQPGGITDIAAESELIVQGGFTAGGKNALANLTNVELGGTLALGNGQTTNITPIGGVLTNSGNIDVGPAGSTMKINGDVTTFRSGSIQIGTAGGTLEISGVLTNNGALGIDDNGGGVVNVGKLINNNIVGIGLGATLNLTSQPGGITDIETGTEFQIAGTFTAGAHNALANLTSVEGVLLLWKGEMSNVSPTGGALVIANGGYTEVNTGATLQINGDVNNSGSLLTGDLPFAGGNTLTITGTLTNHVEAEFFLIGPGDRATLGGLTNSGTVYVDSGSTLQINGDAGNSGILGTCHFVGCAGNNTVTVTGLLTNEASGQVILNGRGDVLQALAGLGNNGVINVNNGSSIDPPFLNNLGMINIDGMSRLVVGTPTPMGGQGYIQLANGTLGEMISSTGFGVINVKGSALLDGTLAILLQGGYNPAVGSMYKFLLANPGQVNGAFASILNGVFNSGTEKWLVTYDNAEGFVELTAEANNVPEPATLLVLIPGLLGVGYALRRRPDPRASNVYRGRSAALLRRSPWKDHTRR